MALVQKCERVQCDGTSTLCVEKEKVQCDGTGTKKCDDTYLHLKEKVQCDGTGTWCVEKEECLV